MNDLQKNGCQDTHRKNGSHIVTVTVRLPFFSAGVFIMTRVLYWSVSTLAKSA